MFVQGSHPNCTLDTYIRLSNHYNGYSAREQPACKSRQLKPKGSPTRPLIPRILTLSSGFNRIQWLVPSSGYPRRTSIGHSPVKPFRVYRFSRYEVSQDGDMIQREYLSHL